MTLLACVIALFLQCASIVAQTPTIKWQKCAGGSSDDVTPTMSFTADGGYIMAGYTLSNDGDVTTAYGSNDYWVVKFAADGTLQWQKSLGGNSEDRANSIRQTSDGGYIVAGYTYSDNIDVSDNHGGSDCWIVKLDASGNLIWQHCYGGSGEDAAYSIQETTDGGYVFAAYTLSNDGDVSGIHGGGDFWIVKLDNNGALEWQEALGGTNLDIPSSVIQTSDGGYIAAGYTYSNNLDVSGNHGSYDYWVVKLDSNGDLEWQHCYGGSDIDAVLGNGAIKQTLDGGYIIVGVATSQNGDVTGNHGGNDYWVIKITSVGTLEWQLSLGGVSDDQAFAIQQAIDGGYIIAGSTSSIDGDVSGNHGWYDLWLVKLTPFGVMEWQKCFGGTNVDGGTATLQVMTDGTYCTGAITNSNDGDVSGNHGSYDYWILALNGHDVATGIENSIATISMYPNPCKDVLYITVSKPFIYTLRNVFGQILISATCTNGKILTNELPDGVYILTAMLDESVNQKIIKQ